MSTFKGSKGSSPWLGILGVGIFGLEIRFPWYPGTVEIPASLGAIAGVYRVERFCHFTPRSENHSGEEVGIDDAMEGMHFFEIHNLHERISVTDPPSPKGEGFGGD